MHNLEAYKDKTCAGLANPRIRGKITNSILRKEDCDSNKVWKLLSLLVILANRRSTRATHEIEITEVE